MIMQPSEQTLKEKAAFKEKYYLIRYDYWEQYTWGITGQTIARAYYRNEFSTPEEFANTPWMKRQYTYAKASTKPEHCFRTIKEAKEYIKNIMKVKPEIKVKGEPTPYGNIGAKHVTYKPVRVFWSTGLDGEMWCREYDTCETV